MSTIDELLDSSKRELDNEKLKELLAKERQHELSGIIAALNHVRAPYKAMETQLSAANSKLAELENMLKESASKIAELENRLRISSQPTEGN